MLFVVEFNNKRYVTEVVADEVSFIEWGNKSSYRKLSDNDDFGNGVDYGDIPIGDDMTLIDDDVPF